MPRPKGLPKTGGRKPGSPNKVTLEIRDRARQILESPTYQASLLDRLEAGTAGAVETLLYHYAYGKPKDVVEIPGDESRRPRIIVEYVNEA